MPCSVQCLTGCYRVETSLREVGNIGYVGKKSIALKYEALKFNMDMTIRDTRAHYTI